MAKRRFTTRREMEEHHFSALVALGAPLLALFITAYLPKLFPVTAIVDLPLIVVIYFAISRRSPITGTLTGAAIGLLQDTLSNQYIGVNGIAKSIVGFAAASIGVKVDVDNLITRAMLMFGFSLLQSAVLFGVQRVLLGSSLYQMGGLHEVLRALFNTAVAIPVFLLLDVTRTDE